jgi:uncharacterized protein Usg
MLIRRTTIVTLDIFYYRPDYQNLIQEFVWSLDDYVPELQRTHKFLKFWQQNIDAVIKEILLGVSGATPRKLEAVDHLFRLN